MATFTYKALQAAGSSTEGSLEASNRADALRQLEALKLRPVRVTESKPVGKAGAANGGSGNAKDDEELAKGKVTAKMLENFTRLLSSLLSSGVPFSRALVILHREAAEPVARAKWKQIHDMVVDGMSLSEAMARFPETFPKVYVAMVEAGEVGGFLDVVLGQIADFQAREKELQGRVLTALLYPIILLCLALGVLVFMLVFFIPRFQQIFAGFNAELPLITQIIVGTSEVVRSYGLFLLAGLVIAFIMGRSWLASDKGRRVWEAWILRIPKVGPLIARYAMTRFCRMLGTLLGAGVPLINALNVARRSIGNQVMMDAVTVSIEEVRGGKALGVSLAKNRELFPGAVIEMISVAEESGRLDQELVRIANASESEWDRELRTVVALAEPLLLFFIAAFIGTIFIGMVIPIFSLQDHIK